MEIVKYSVRVFCQRDLTGRIPYGSEKTVSVEILEKYVKETNGQFVRSGGPFIAGKEAMIKLFRSEFTGMEQFWYQEHYCIPTVEQCTMRRISPDESIFAYRSDLGIFYAYVLEISRNPIKCDVCSKDCGKTVFFIKAIQIQCQNLYLSEDNPFYFQETAGFRTLCSECYPESVLGNPNEIG